jgi:hypothetical protein
VYGVGICSNISLIFSSSLEMTTALVGTNVGVVVVAIVVVSIVVVVILAVDVVVVVVVVVVASTFSF